MFLIDFSLFSHLKPAKYLYFQLQQEFFFFLIRNIEGSSQAQFLFSFFSSDEVFGIFSAPLICLFFLERIMRFLVGLFYFKSFLLLFRVCWAYFSRFSDIDGQENLRLIVESTEFKNKTATASYVDNLGMK
jgi:hypothetical protein